MINDFGRWGFMKISAMLVSILLVVAVVGISGCISSDNTTASGNAMDLDLNDTGSVVSVDSGDDVHKKQEANMKSKKDNGDKPRISEEDVINKLKEKYSNEDVNYSFKVVKLVYDDDKSPIYIVDVYNESGIIGYYGIDAVNGSVVEGAFNDEVHVNDDKTQNDTSQDNNTNDNSTNDSSEASVNASHKLSEDDAKRLVKEKLDKEYNITSNTFKVSESSVNSTSAYDVEVLSDESGELLAKVCVRRDSGDVLSLNISSANTSIDVSDNSSGDVLVCGVL